MNLSFKSIDVLLVHVVHTCIRKHTIPGRNYHAKKKKTAVKNTFKCHPSSMLSKILHSAKAT